MHTDLIVVVLFYLALGASGSFHREDHFPSQGTDRAAKRS